MGGLQVRALLRPGQLDGRLEDVVEEGVRLHQLGQLEGVQPARLLDEPGRPLFSFDGTTGLRFGLGGDLGAVSPRRQVPQFLGLRVRHLLLPPCRGLPPGAVNHERGHLLAGDVEVTERSGWIGSGVLRSAGGC